MRAEASDDGVDVSLSQRRRKRVVLRFAVAIALLLLLLLLLRRCPGSPPGVFDYFDARAEALGRDRAKVVRWVRELPDLPYRGNARGALATLWEEAGAPEEKLELARAVVARCSDTATPTLSEVSSAAGESDPAVARVRVMHRGATDTVVWEGPPGDLVGNVHTVETTAPGTTRVTLRAAANVVRELRVDGARSESLVFEIDLPAGPRGPEKRTVERELWHADNETGPTCAATGDRHDFVVLPCRVGKYVREKEEILLAQRGEKDAPHARGYLALLDYARRSDVQLASIEKDKGVRATFAPPRILILSRLRPPGTDGEWVALDLRLDRAGFAGPAERAYEAALVRSYAEGGLEQQFLSSWSRQPCTSAHDVFSRLRDDYPDSPDRRLLLARDSLAVLAEHGGADGRVSFEARSPAGKAVAGAARATVRREGAALRVEASGLREDLQPILRERFPDIPAEIRGGNLSVATDDPLRAALLVELALMGGGTGRTPPDYVLDAQIDPGTEPLVVEGARFGFRWETGAGTAEQTVRILNAGDTLNFRWKVRTDVRPVSGIRCVGREALDSAEVHNPWYAAGDSQQSDATSFCLSRRVLRALQAGESCPLTLLGRRPDDDEAAPRPVEWKGVLEPVGKGRRKVRVNGRDEEVEIVRFRIGGADSAVLNDAIWPVGMADRLVEVETAVRGRIVDEQGLGYAGLRVEVGAAGFASGGAGGSPAVTTWPDGRFRLPPAPLEGRGTVEILVLKGEEGEEEELLREAVDLSAPGLDEIRLTVPRHRREIVFVHPDRADDLSGVRLSSQAARHARAELGAGRSVMIPNRPVELNGSPATAFYALDRATGDMTAVMDDGLHGSSSSQREAWKQAIASAAESAVKAKGQLGNLAAVHMLRGANTAWWTYSSHRLGGSEHDESVMATLAEMAQWEKATNILKNFGEVAGEKAQQKLSDMLGEAGFNLDDDGAEAAFKIGYILALAHLAFELEESD